MFYLNLVLSERQFSKVTKAKKDKQAPWEMFDSNKQQEDDTNFSPTNPDSVFGGLEEPTSGIDLPVQVLPFEDFDSGYIDLEIPLKVVLFVQSHHHKCSPYSMCVAWAG